MPLPTPTKGEEESHFVSRCIAFETDANPGRDPKQIQAMCFQKWRDNLSQDKDDLAAASEKDWGSINKSQLPASCFLWVEDPDKKETWHLPVYEGSGGIDPKTGMYRGRGPLNFNALRAAAAAVGGARTSKAMSVPASVRAKLEGLLERNKIGE